MQLHQSAIFSVDSYVIFQRFALLSSRLDCFVMVERRLASGTETIFPATKNAHQRSLARDSGSQGNVVHL